VQSLATGQPASERDTTALVESLRRARAYLPQVTVNDSVFTHNDHGDVDLEDGTVYNTLEPLMGRLYDVRVMRNKFDHIGIRPDLFGQGGALVVGYAQTMELNSV